MLLRGGRGGSGPKFSKTFFEITVDSEVPPSGPTFWSGLGTRDPLSQRGWSENFEVFENGRDNSYDQNCLVG